MPQAMTTTCIFPPYILFQRNFKYWWPWCCHSRDNFVELMPQALTLSQPILGMTTPSGWSTLRLEGWAFLGAFGTVPRLWDSCWDGWPDGEVTVSAKHRASVWLAYVLWGHV